MAMMASYSKRKMAKFSDKLTFYKSRFPDPVSGQYVRPGEN